MHFFVAACVKPSVLCTGMLHGCSGACAVAWRAMQCPGVVVVEVAAQVLALEVAKWQRQHAVRQQHVPVCRTVQH